MIRVFIQKHVPLLLLSAVCAWPQTVNTGGTFGSIISLNGSPSDLLIDEVRQRIYLVNSNANRIDMLDMGSKRLVKSVNTGAYPLSIAISPDNASLYVTCTQSASITVIDLGNDSPRQSVSLPAKPEGIAVGSDGRVLITTQGTGTNNTSNTLLLFDPKQERGREVVPIASPPPINTPNPLAAIFAGKPATPFPGQLIPTPNKDFIIGMVAINQNVNGAQTTLFVYEVSSGIVLKNRTVTGQSTILSMSLDGTRFMAGSTLYESNSLAVIGQMSASNLPFFTGNGFSPGFNVQRNFGGSTFSSDGETLYSAFNTAATAARPVANVLYIGNSKNLGVSLGIKLKESILGKLASSADGKDIYAISESGLTYLPISTLYDYPIIAPETTQVFLANDECNKGVARTSLAIKNLGKGSLSYSIPNITAALVTEIENGRAPSSISFVMEPGRSGIVRQAGTNLFNAGGGTTGTPINVTLQSPEAINFPSIIRVYMNFRNRDQRGIVYPVPNVPTNNNQGLIDMVLDQPRSRIYISNAGFNRIEVFDTKKLKFMDPIPVGQLPRAMAMTPDGATLYVGNSGGESISIIDLDSLQGVGNVEFPPIPRIGGQAAITPIAMAFGLSGLQFMMSNGTFWRLVGNTATPRPLNTVTPTAIGGPISMVSSAGGEYILTVAGNGTAYLYDALADTYVISRSLYDQTPVSYFGPAAGSKTGSYFLANGFILSPSLAIIGGFERPGVTQFGPPAGPGQPPTQTIVSNGDRNIAALYPLNDTSFIRMTTPVRQNINAATRDDTRMTMEIVNTVTGEESLVGIAPENPVNNVFGATRVNVPSRQLVVDTAGIAYAITVSGLTMIPLQLSGTPIRPAITAGSRGVVNSTDGTPNLSVGAFITINGANLGAASTADKGATPRVLGGSCVTVNDLPLELLSVSATQISARIPDNVIPGTAILQVKSLAVAEQSDPVVISIRK